jgi:hypothetical protein
VDFVLAVNNFGDTRSGGLAGPMGLFIIVLLCIATVLLIRNMNKRVRRLPDSFADPATVQREAEIARLESDLRHTSAEPADVDDRQSAGSSDGQNSEVSGVPAAEAPQPRRADGAAG